MSYLLQVTLSALHDDYVQLLLESIPAATSLPPTLLYSTNDLVEKVNDNIDLRYYRIYRKFLQVFLCVVAVWCSFTVS